MNVHVGPAIVLLLSSNALAAEPPSTTLFDYNAGSDTDWPEWTWNTDLNSFGATGWMLTGTDPHLGVGSPNARSNGNNMPWSHNKFDTNPNDTAVIDTSRRSPSTSSGGSLRVYETSSGEYNAGWWVLYDGKPLKDSGIAGSKTNRMSFYLRYDGVSGQGSIGNAGDLGQSFHIGTYLCWAPSCPYEGPGNQHYYHYLAIEPGAWLHIVLNQTPQHLRGDGPPGSNPVSSAGKNYFEQIHQMYMETRYRSGSAGDLASFNVDEIQFYSTFDTVVPNQNEESINSTWVGYWPSSDTWRIGWSDDSYGGNHSDNTWSTFEVRWSVFPITDANYAAANILTSEPNSYGGAEYTGAANLIRKSHSYGRFVYTQFKLADSIESNNARIYFAIKDVSSAGAHAGTKYPYTRTDGHDAPSSNLTLIDYHLESAVSGAPSPPGNLVVQ
ncbi:MAG: hypothetical protein M3094_00890 [Actinomycetia bacterium]|nr:hypothetical protein [Actinomycetes bacterium]